MAERLGIELSPGAWRIVDIDDGLPWRRYRAGTRVRSFAVVPPHVTGLEEMFGRVRDRAASVVVWGARTDHRQVIVNRGTPDSMRREALSSLSAAGIATDDVLADVVAVRSAAAPEGRQLVAVALAQSHAMSDAIAPLIDAGIHVRALMTPAAALASLAQTRRKTSE